MRTVDPDRQTTAPPPRRRPRPGAGRRRPGRPTSPLAIYLALLIGLVVVALLSAPRLVTAARGLPYGLDRDIQLAVASGFDRVAGAVGLNRPALWIEAALGHGEAAPSFADAARPPAATAPPATSGPTAATQPTATTAAPTAPATATSAPTAAPTTQPAAVNQPAPTPAPSPTTLPPSPTPARPSPTVAPPAATPRPGQRAITAAAPLRVFVAGDSFVDWLGQALDGYSQEEKMIATRLESKVSSGLALPEFFDWPARLRQIMAGEPSPEAVVLFLGANDFKIMDVNGKKVEQLTPEWKAEYARRAGTVMDIIGQRGGRLYWVGMPIVRQEWHNEVMMAINAAIASEAASRPWVRFFDIAPMFADEQGGYTAFRPDSRGEMVRVRQDDGTHLTRVATAWVAERVYGEMKNDWAISTP